MVKKKYRKSALSCYACAVVTESRLMMRLLDFSPSSADTIRTNGVVVVVEWDKSTKQMMSLAFFSPQ